MNWQDLGAFVISFVFCLLAGWLIVWSIRQDTEDREDRRLRGLYDDPPQDWASLTDSRPSRTQKGDPEGYSWPWELTEKEGPETDGHDHRGKVLGS
jgi:hypothetical protein